MCVFSYVGYSCGCVCDLDLDPMTLIVDTRTLPRYSEFVPVYQRSTLKEVGTRTGQTPTQKYGYSEKDRRDRTHYHATLPGGNNFL